MFFVTKKEKNGDQTRFQIARLNKVEKFFDSRLLRDTNAYWEPLRSTQCSSHVYFTLELGAQSRIHSVVFPCVHQPRTQCTEGFLKLIIYRIYTLRKYC